MKIKLSKSQWEGIGKKAGWIMTSSNKNHKNFDNKKDALKFLSDNALMSVGWKNENGMMEACYWNGKVHITKKNEDGAITKENKADTGLIVEAQGRMNRNEEEMYPSTGKPIKQKLPADVPIQTEHIEKMQKMLHAINLAIPCLEYWISTTGHGELNQRDKQALNALKESIAALRGGVVTGASLLIHNSATRHTRR